MDDNNTSSTSSSLPCSITYPSSISTHDDHNSNKLVDKAMMDGPDDDSNNDDDPPWSVVDSWINYSPQINNDDDDQNNMQCEVGGISGVDKGKSKITDHGKEIECGTEDQCPDDDDDDDDELQSQVVWPTQFVPGSCSHCQLLREIVHTKGAHTTKLEIHGTLGFISHAVYGSNDGLSDSEFRNTYMLDFSRHNVVDIRDYLKSYTEELRKNGYSLSPEPLSLFYEALCVGYDWLNSPGNNNSGRTFERGESSNQAIVPDSIVQQRADEQLPTVFKTELTIQRERVKGMRLEDLAKYFDLRMKDASEQLHLCASVLKKKLRSYKIPRWPFRKVESIKRKISDLEAKKYLRPDDHWLEREIQKLRQRLCGILSGKLKP